MPDRTRPIRKEICLNEQGLNLIQHKMRQLGTHNFCAYAHKMLSVGYGTLHFTFHKSYYLRFITINFTKPSRRT